MRGVSAALVVASLVAVSLVLSSRVDAARSLQGAWSQPPFVGAPPSMCPAPLADAQFTAPARHGERAIALTFDDGPGRSTQAIIDILESFHVRATFFNVGQEELYRPMLVQEEAADGFLLGDHTVSHPDMTTLSAAAQAEEIDGVVHETRQLTGTSPCAFRPPGGSYDATTLSLARSRHMSFWMWNASADDWEARGSGSPYWVHHIISAVESEGIATSQALVLFHNQPILMPATVAALPIVIRFFLDHGYVFEDLLGRIGPPGTCGRPSAAPTSVPGTLLRVGVTMTARHARRSPSGQFALTMEPGGNLVLQLATGRVLWSANTGGHPGARLAVESSGNVEIISRSGATLWASGTSGNAGAALLVSDAGDVAVQLGSKVLWRSSPVVARLLAGERLFPGWRLTSPGGQCTLLDQPSGSLALVDAARQLLWRVPATAAGAHYVLEHSGNLVEVAPSGTTTWDSGTGTNGPAQLTVLDAGRLVIRAASRPLWATP
jgi:peptidoglycan/xylan/chitin deacetylase (PgdA/CDA1 family)